MTKEQVTLNAQPESVDTPEQAPAFAQKEFPEFVRVAQICGGILPISAGLWWRWVRDGVAPRPFKPSSRVSLWRRSDVFAVAEQQFKGK